MSDDIRDILGKLQTITEAKTTPVAVKQGLNPQQKSVKQMPALFQPKSIKVLGTKTDPKHPAAGYFVGGESQQEPAAKPSGIAKGLNRAGGRIATSAPESFRPVKEGGCNSTMEGVYCPKHGMNECGMSESMDTVTEQAMQIDDYDRWLDLVNSQGASVHMQKNQTQAVAQHWSGEIIGEFNLRTNQGFIDSSYLDEAGPFSYGAKKPRKGSVADLAAQKRKEQEKGKQPVEPKDHMVGVARVKKDVAEGAEDIVAVIDGVRSDRTYNDKDHAHNSLGKLVAYGKAKVAELYINGEKVEHFEIGKKYKDFEPKQLDSMAEGEITKTDTGLKHSAVGRYGGGSDDEFSRDFGKYARDLTSLNKDTTKKLDQAFGVKHQHGNAKDKDLDENLRKWFREKWVRFGPDGKIRGDCARGDDSEGKPKCLPQSKAHSLGKKGRASAAARKRREDPNPERTGKAINVATKRRADEDCWDGYQQQGMKKKGDRMVPNCVPVDEQLCPECGGQMFPLSMINEKQDACYYKVKSRYKVWPSAYASGALVQCRKKGAKNWGKKSNESIAEDTTTEDVLSKMKQKLGDYLQDVATAIKKDPDLMNKLPKSADTIGPAVRTLKTDDGHEIKIHGNEDDGFRVTIRNRPGPTRFASLDEASMAVEMYIAHRRQQELEEDYIEER
jgi:hypothetical protein